MGHGGVEVVVEGEFGAGGDGFFGEEESAAADDAFEDVCVAAVVDAFGSGAAKFGVDDAVGADFQQVERFLRLPVVAVAFGGFCGGETLARVLDDFGAAGNIGFGEDADRVNAGPADTQRNECRSRIDARRSSLPNVRLPAFTAIHQSNPSHRKYFLALLRKQVHQRGDWDATARSAVGSLHDDTYTAATRAISARPRRIIYIGGRP